MVDLSNLDSFQGAVTLATVIDVAHVIAQVFSVNDEARLELGKVKGGVWRFSSSPVGKAGFGDDFADVFVDELVRFEINFRTKAQSSVWG